MDHIIEAKPPAELEAHAPDAHWAVVASDGTVKARCSLWWMYVPHYTNQRVGVIGHFDTTDTSATTRLLTHACEQLAARGATIAIGPMDGNTWRKYRLVTERGSEPPFFLEPDNPDTWPRCFTDAGFAPLATYTSALNTALVGEDPRVARGLERMNSIGVRIRQLDPSRFDEELDRIYEISSVSFRDNFLYTPIAKNEFISMYRKIQPYVQAELVLIAERDGKPVGFLFGIPDMAQAQRGAKIDTFIVKTVAVVPDSGCTGLGSLLVAQSQLIAHQLGYRRAIHALMHETNRSQNISRHYAQTMRRYTLFAKPLRS